MSESDKVVEVERREDGVAVLRLARPSKLNALSAELLRQLEAALIALDGDSGVGCIVLTGGEGTKRPSFAAGADIGEMSAMSGLEMRAHAKLGQRVTRRLEGARVSTIAAVNGFAFGGGLEMAMACHIRYFAEGAKVGQPEVNLGLVPGFGGTQRLPRLVGRGKALEMLLDGDPIGSAEAVRIGLAERVFPDAELLPKTLERAALFASKAPVARELILDAVVRGTEMPLDAALDLEADLFGTDGATEDAKEGTSAFMQKRQATWKGR